MEAEFKRWVIEPLELQHLISQGSHNSHETILVDCRFALTDPQWGRNAYLESHIPGAYYLHLNEDLSGPVTDTSGRHPLPDIDQFQETLSAIGIHSGESTVIIYDQGNLGFACRLWWLLNYLGHTKVRILNGGFDNWARLGYPTSNNPPTPVQGQFIAHPKPTMLAHKTFVSKQSLENMGALIDSRETKRFLGEEEPIDPVAGRIPNAINLPFHEVVDEGGFIKPLAFHQKRWRTYNSDHPTTVYCGSGVTACVNLFSMALAGLEDSKLYIGSWSEWCSDPKLPVAKGEA
jgi:thiosulfate/3-mercaptopyruvate sulfurtransferase